MLFRAWHFSPTWKVVSTHIHPLYVLQSYLQESLLVWSGGNDTTAGEKWLQKRRGEVRSDAMTITSFTTVAGEELGFRDFPPFLAFESSA